MIVLLPKVAVSVARGDAYNSYDISFLFFGTEDGTWDLALGKQALRHWAKYPANISYSYSEDKHLYEGEYRGSTLAENYAIFPFASMQRSPKTVQWVCFSGKEIKKTCNVESVRKDAIKPKNPSVSAFQSTGITDLHHHTEL